MKKQYKTPKIATDELAKTDVLCESKPDNGNFRHSKGTSSQAPETYEIMGGMAEDIFAI